MDGFVAGPLPRWSGLSASPVPGGVAIVLGNAVTADRQPSPRLRARLDRAVALYRADVATRILVSGGIEKPRRLDEAAIMQAYLQQAGIPASAIIADHAGTNTAATARNAVALLGRDTPMIAVTQWFHVPRTMLMLRRAGVGKVSGARPAYAEWRGLFSLFREAVAIPAALLRPRGVAVASLPSSASST